MGRIFPHVLAYPDQNAEKSCKEEGGGGEGEGEGEFARIEHAAKQQLKKHYKPNLIVLTLNVCREDVLVEDDKVLDELVDEVLVLDLVPFLRDWNERGPEADGQVVGVHHVLVAELGQVVEEREQVTHDDEDGSRPSPNHVTNLDDELVLRFQL